MDARSYHSIHSLPCRINPTRFTNSQRLDKRTAPKASSFSPSRKYPAQFHVCAPARQDPPGSSMSVRNRRTRRFGRTCWGSLVGSWAGRPLRLRVPDVGHYRQLGWTAISCDTPEEAASSDNFGDGSRPCARGIEIFPPGAFFECTSLRCKPAAPAFSNLVSRPRSSQRRRRKSMFKPVEPPRERPHLPWPPFRCHGRRRPVGFLSCNSMVLSGPPMRVTVIVSTSGFTVGASSDSRRSNRRARFLMSDTHSSSYL